MTPPFVSTNLSSEASLASLVSPKPKMLNPLLTAFTAGKVTDLGPSLHPPIN